MAGIQSCRKLLGLTTSRVLNNNGIFLQPSRKRHHLVFQIYSMQYRLAYHKSKLVSNTGTLLTYRLASTSVPESKVAASNAINSETPGAKSDSAQLNNASDIVESSSKNIVIDESLLPPVPTSEPIEAPVMEFVSTGLKEPSFQSLGLGSWWPSGLIQQFLEYLHIGLDLPWWEAIVVVSLVSRILLFPVNLKTRRDSINMTNNLPELQKIQIKITDARTSGDYYAVARHSEELQNFVKEKQLNMLGFLRTALIQGPVFISIYYALKGMVNAPVESLKTEGLLWFTDLTQMDPYYILPLTLSSTLFVILEIGAEGNPAKASTHTMKWLLRGIPVLIFVVTMRFSACITWYWTISNLIVLAQVALLKVPYISKALNIPKVKYIDSSKLPKSKGFIEGFKEGFSQAKMSRQIADRERMNLNAFKKAGTAPIPRTFKQNPLLQQAKKNVKSLVSPTHPDLLRKCINDFIT